MITIRIPYSQPEMLASVIHNLNEEGISEATVEVYGNAFQITIPDKPKSSIYNILDKHQMADSNCQERR